MYWAWWISWSPFVGLFIARVSKGRSIREFIAGVMLIPTGFTLVWMGFMGNAALYSILHEANLQLMTAVQQNKPVPARLMHKWPRHECPSGKKKYASPAALPGWWPAHRPVATHSASPVQPRPKNIRPMPMPAVNSIANQEP